MTKALLRNIKRQKIFNYLLIVSLMCLQSFVLTICVPEVIKKIVSSILDGTKETGFILLLFLGIYFVYSILQLLNRIISFYYQKYATKKIEQKVLEYLCKLDEWQFHYDGLTILAQIRNDVYQISSMWILLLNQKIGIYTSVIFGTVYGLYANKYVYLGCMVVTGIIFCITKEAYPKLKEFEYKIGNEFNKNYANINEIINNIGIIHLLNSKKVIMNFQEVSRKNVELNIGKGRVFAYVFICKKISNVVLVFLTCFLGVLFMKIQDNFITVVSEVSALAYLMPNISKKILELIDVGIQSSNIVSTEKRIDSIFELEEYDEMGKVSILHIDQISVKNLCFSYAEKRIISDLSFEMKKGTVTALRGVSGCGKSTLIKLLCRVIPVGNDMIFINLKDINTINRLSIWENISYVSQISHVVRGTIKENILNGEEFDNRKYQDALYVSTLVDALHNFQNGADQMIDEEKISSGEKQKIALARALYKQPDFLCMDEVISAMDPVSQKLVFKRLVDYVKKYNIFCVYVSHVSEEDEYSEIEEIWL